MLEVDDLHVRYHGVPAVRGVSFVVPDRRIVGLVGANGAGKTSTLNALMGLVPRSGRVSMDGVEIGAAPTDAIVRHGVVQVAQGRQLFADMSVRDNLELGAFLLSAPDRRDKLATLCARFPLLQQRSAQRAGTLSGGEQQMVAIARALMAAPKILLLDEPCLGLSPKMVLALADTVRQLHEEGLAILLVEQNAAFVFALANEVMVMENGRIGLVGTPDELRSNDAVRRSYLGI